VKLFAQPQELADWENRYRSGGTGYSDAKKRLAELVIDYFKPFREKRAELEHNPSYVREVLAEGARRAASVAVETLTAARNAVGLGAHYGR
jgi:tryptophanyl-tRNA synthetase